MAIENKIIGNIAGHQRSFLMTTVGDIEEFSAQGYNDFSCPAFVGGVENDDAIKVFFSNDGKNWSEWKGGNSISYSYGKVECLVANVEVSINLSKR